MAYSLGLIAVYADAYGRTVASHWQLTAPASEAVDELVRALGYFAPTDLFRDQALAEVRPGVILGVDLSGGRGVINGCVVQESTYGAVVEVKEFLSRFSVERLFIGLD